MSALCIRHPSTVCPSPFIACARLHSRSEADGAIFSQGVEMTSNDMRGSTTLPAAVPIPDRVSTYLTAVYGWMCTGLAITAATAWFIARSPALVALANVRPPDDRR